MARRPSGRKAEENPPAPADAPPSPTNGDRQPPAAEFRLGRIRATIWANFSENHGTWYSIVVTRSYKDGQGNWKTAQSFGRDDLLVVGEVTRLAYHWVCKQQGGGLRVSLETEAETTHGPEEDIPF